MLHSFSFDPEEILGVRSGASLEEVRAAYHAQAKKYHPDVKGDAWAFRMVTRAYEILGRARIAARVAEEQARSAPAPAPTTPRRPTPPPLNTQEPGAEHIRAGVRDAVSDPIRLVDVEIFLIRYEMDDPTQFFLTSPEDRNLSCNLNLSWPSRRADAPPSDPRATLKALTDFFKPLAKKTGANGSRALAEDQRFSAWLSYPTAAKAKEAFQIVHAALRQAGFGVDQRTRELLLPRNNE